ncbi:MAG TPA: isovaleryl-CoA dehydrogenase [Casimicrobiaceae bacterium]|nr:isovaleryl-CoA dehydrogenase [Casimicrobiaceae bacterium]
MTGTTFPNQPPPFEGHNLFAIDAALRHAVERQGAAWAVPELMQWGAALGTSETYAQADAANRNPPTLRAYDRRGERIDDVAFHPAWHALMRLAMAAGEHCAPWRTPQSGAQVARAAMYYLHAQVENGTQCPLTMTYASVPVLTRHAADLPVAAGPWLPMVLATDYDPRALPIGQKRSALIGMGMTERQGGSDLRANLTRAVPDAEGAWAVTGHKWFFSAPQCDAHLVLAQTDAGLGCFLMPRIRPDGMRNAIRVNRLKDKLGNRSNASSEVEFAGALAWPIGATNRGIATILEMVQYTRLDCVIGSAGIMRAAAAWSIHHARHRSAFGRLLADQPLMTNVLADLALESEASLWFALRLAGACEADAGDAARAAARIITPAAKYWVCKRAIAVTAEAMEALGGNGYVEENPLPRFYREAPVNSIWEGSGNVVCLDVARAARKEPDALDALLADLGSVRGANASLDRHAATLAPLLRGITDEPATARHVAQAVALAVSAAELVRHAPDYVADAYCAARLTPDICAGAAFGSLSRAADTKRIVERALIG